MDARAEFVDGLLALAAAIEDNPGLPLPDGQIRLCVLGSDDEAGCEQVDAFANAVGVQARWEGGDLARYEASAKFGPITYETYYCTREAMLRWRARSSYNANVAAVS